MAIEVPEHLRTGPMAEAAARALQDAAAMAASSNSVPRISLRGREFRFIDGGEELYKFREEVLVNILGVEPEAGLMIKTFYKNGYTQGAKEPPTCSSEDGIAPNAWVPEKQNPTCRDCPKNRFGSAVSNTGKQTKACRDSKRIWLKMANGNFQPGPPGQPMKLIELEPFADRTLFGMNVTVASLKAFSEYGKVLNSLGQGPAVCVTKMKMVDSEFPQVEFEVAAWLGVEDAPIALEMSERRPWKIKYANAGLALSAPEGGVRSSLPSSLPGLPPHLQQSGPADGTVASGESGAPIETVPAASRPVGDIGSAVDKW